jgi:hypothetical protein
MKDSTPIAQPATSKRRKAKCKENDEAKAKKGGGEEGRRPTFVIA